jgi:hypothetical protein
MTGFASPSRSAQATGIQSKRLIPILFSMMGLAAVLVILSQVISSPAPALAIGERTCRFNITVPEGVSGYEDRFPLIKVDSYLDWAHRTSPSNPNGAEYIQMLRVSDSAYATSLADIPTVVPANPGSYWIVGNEPDRVAYQDDLLPEVYADRFYAVATAIRSQDPTAKIGFGSIVQPTSIRLRYLDRAWTRLIEVAGSAYAASDLIDFWSLHAFILCEDCGWGAAVPPGMTPTPGELLHIDAVCSTAPDVTCYPETHDNAVFNQFVGDFRTWMAAKSEREKPLWITEYGSLMPEYLVPISESTRFMEETFDHLLSATDPAGYPADGDKLVQRWFWFSLNHDPTSPSTLNMGGHLYDPTAGGAITGWGTAWLNYGYIFNTATFPADPYPLGLRAASNGTSGWTFTMGVANQGDASFEGGYTVELFDGDPDAGGAQLGSSVHVSDALRGCGAQDQVTIDASPGSLPPWDLYARVIPDQPANDVDTGNNTVGHPSFKPQTFADVSPADWSWSYVETINAYGIITGCAVDPLVFCPDVAVDRANMAMFLLRGIFGAGYTPPPASDPPAFPDIDGHPLEAWIEELYEMGLVAGHPDGTYRPDDPVNRAQMAVYLLRAKNKDDLGYLPPPPIGGVFTDIDGHWAQAWIEELANQGIAAGHPDGSYRPDDIVKQSQMSVFLLRTFNLVLVV